MYMHTVCHQNHLKRDLQHCLTCLAHVRTCAARHSSRHADLYNQELRKAGLEITQLGLLTALAATEDIGGLHSALIPDTMETVEYLDQSMLHQVDFRHRKGIRHLLGEARQQVTVASHRLFEGIHHPGADQRVGK
jgi:hypothetical protein